MGRLLILAAIVIIAFRMFTGRWPWQKRRSAHEQATEQARKLLGVSASASRGEIITAHRRIMALVHPDKGGTNAQVHEVNNARDLLLAQLPPAPPPKPSSSDTQEPL